MAIKTLAWSVAVLLVLLVTAIIPVTTILLDQFEHRVKPVVVDVYINQAWTVDALHTEVRGTFRKVRDCRFEELRWYQGVRGSRSVRVDLKFHEDNKIRGSGLEEFGPWVIGVNRDLLFSTSYADVWHQCFIGDIPLPWLTRTPFFN